MAREAKELSRRERVYRGGRPPPRVTDRTVVLVDDGIATGATMHAAVQALRASGPRRLIVAVPVAPASTREELRPAVDDLVCLASPEPFLGVGRWYRDFSQTTDAEVRSLLATARPFSHPPMAPVRAAAESDTPQASRASERRQMTKSGALPDE